MSALDVIGPPAPAPQPLGKLIVRHALVEAGLQLRNGEQLLLSAVIPLAVLIIGSLSGLVPIAVLAPSVIALALWSSGFTGTAIATGFERRYGVLERLAATPLTRLGLVAGKALGVTLIAALQLVLVAGVAVVMGWRPAPTGAGVLVVIATTALAMIAAVGLALLMAGRLRAEVTLALANVVHLALAAGGGLVVPVAALPGPLRPIAALLPTGALGEAWRGFSLGGFSLGGTGGLPVVVAGVWAVLAVALASRLFRWLA